MENESSSPPLYLLQWDSRIETSHYPFQMSCRIAVSGHTDWAQMFVILPEQSSLSSCSLFTAPGTQNSNSLGQEETQVGTRFASLVQQGGKHPSLLSSP